MIVAGRPGLQRLHDPAAILGASVLGELELALELLDLDFKADDSRDQRVQEIGSEATGPVTVRRLEARAQRIEQFAGRFVLENRRGAGDLY
jgi:hypothetical protein